MLDSKQPLIKTSLEILATFLRKIDILKIRSSSDKKLMSLHHGEILVGIKHLPLLLPTQRQDSVLQKVLINIYVRVQKVATRTWRT